MILPIDEIARRSAQGDRPHWVELGQTLDHLESDGLLAPDGEPWRGKMQVAAGISRNHALRCMRAYQFVRELIDEKKVRGFLADYTALASESIDVIHRYYLFDPKAALDLLEEAVQKGLSYRKILDKYSSARDRREQPANIRQVGMTTQAFFRKLCRQIFARNISVFSGLDDGDAGTPIDNKVSRSGSSVDRLLNFDLHLNVGKNESVTVGMRARAYQGDESNTPIYRFNISTSLLESRFVQRYWIFINAGPTADQLVKDLENIERLGYAFAGPVRVGVVAVSPDGSYKITRPLPAIEAEPTGAAGNAE